MVKARSIFFFMGRVKKKYRYDYANNKSKPKTTESKNAHASSKITQTKQGEKLKP